MCCFGRHYALIAPASQVVANELGEIMVFHYSCGDFLLPAFSHIGHLGLKFVPPPPPPNKKSGQSFFDRFIKKKKDQNRPGLFCFSLKLYFPKFLFSLTLFLIFLSYLREKLKMLSVLFTSIS